MSTPTRVYYSEQQRVVIIGASLAFTPGSGALTATADTLNTDRIIVTYNELQDQSGIIRQELGPIMYDAIRKEDNTAAGANVAEVIDYLNDEFAKGPDYQHIDSPAIALTQEDIDTNPQTKFSETLTLVGGTYELKLSFTAWCTATNRQVAAYLEIDSSQATPIFQKEPKDIRDRFWPCRIFTQQFTKGDHAFEFFYGRDGGSGASFAAVQNVFLIVERIGP